MSTSLFEVTEHTIPCQHIREYPHAVKSEQAILRLAIKEYRPLTNLNALPGSVTIIAAHANGLPKETYEPLWDDLLRTFGNKIRAIWIADCSHQGASGVLNEHLQGDDPSWFDHSRDLLGMVNHFRERMPRPIVGLAHSMGVVQFLHLSFMHPRLFYSLALIEPILQTGPPAGPNPAMSTSYRPDFWPSRDEAEASFRKAKFFRIWEPRVLQKYVEYGLHETPTAIYPTGAGSVTLTTTKHQEAWSFARPNFSPMSVDGDEHVERLRSPDTDPAYERGHLFHRAEIFSTFQNLPHVRPSVLWMFGETSYINTPASREEKVAATGKGVGGNGGLTAGKVEKVVVEGAGHMAPFEKVQKCATVIARWLEKCVRNFEVDESFLKEHDSGKSERDMLVVSKQWLKNVRQKVNTARPIAGKL
ncbi:hypothetical protein MMC30_007813 [Trapelia coarctata]|nr:hypothetical protein [Trapelia coarctata]